MNKNTAREDEKPLPKAGWTMPNSRFLSQESLRATEQYAQDLQERVKKMMALGPDLAEQPIESLDRVRQAYAEIFYASDSYKSLLKRYAVSVSTETIAGVEVEIFTPEAGVSDQNRQRVLINLHAGAFIYDSRMASHTESRPVAALGQIKVVSVDYRLAPEFQFPAATDDVLAVYKALLQDYPAENIGLFGWSAGALLTSQTLARLQQEGLPLPGAIAMAAAGAHFWAEGDSGHTAHALYGFDNGAPQENPYFKGVDSHDPLVFPGNSTAILANFPPSLLMSSTRDFALSSLVHTHSQLVKLKVKADLHVWEGLNHAFIYNPDLPESEDASALTAAFFQQHLGLSEHALENPAPQLMDEVANDG